MSRIQQTWQHLAETQRRALILYVTVGYPELNSALDIVPELVAAGADMIELGMPFSDPLAEGVTIQGASQRALQNGVTMRHCLETVRQLRARAVTVPLLLMGYLNPIMRYGIERFCQDAAAAGVDGLILPDLPPEESGNLDAACRANDLDLIMFVAPTSTEQRIAHVADHASGFIYCVSVRGVTGARDQVAADLPDLLARIRSRTHTPLAVGFGIARPDQAQHVAKIADGVIVGSKLIEVIGQAGDVAGFVRGLREGIDLAQPAS